MDATNGTITQVTDGSFATEVAQGLVLVDFWAVWCGPCQQVAPILEDLAGEYAGKIKVAKMDVDSNPQTTQQFNVRSIPSILFFKDGEHVDTVVGLLSGLRVGIHIHLGDMIVPSMIERQSWVGQYHP